LRGSCSAEHARLSVAVFLVQKGCDRRRRGKSHALEEKMFRNTTLVWGWPAKTLHWVGAIVILVLLGHGWWMTHFAPRPDRIAHYNWHAALGYDFLALLVLRLLWRWFNTVPTLPLELRRWERAAAQTGHVLLYLLMLLASFTGWALAGTFRTPLATDLFGLRLPMIVGQDRALHDFFEKSHELLAYALVAVIVLHTVGAFRHHFLKGNDILRRMTWGSRIPAGPI
jgi:cytochrome b561